MGKTPYFAFIKNRQGYTLHIWAADAEAMFMDPTGARGRLPANFQPACMGGPPSRAGVYAVLVRGESPGSLEHVAYIGSSANIRKRLMNPNHVYRRLYERAKGWLVYTRSFPTDDYKYWEKRAIEEFHPLLNVQHNG